MVFYRRFRRFRRRPFALRRRFPRRRFVRRTHRPEVKKITTDVTEVEMLTTGTITHVSPCAQGLDVADRIGNSIWGRYVSIRLRANNRFDSMAAVGASTVLRFMLVQDMEQAGQTPAVAGAGGVLTSAAIDSHLNPDTVGRFKVYWDKTFAINSTSTTGTTSEYNIVQRFARYFKWIPFRNQKIEYTGSASTAVKNGQFYWIALTSETSTGAFDADIRIGYRDN